MTKRRRPNRVRLMNPTPIRRVKAQPPAFTRSRKRRTAGDIALQQAAIDRDQRKLRKELDRLESERERRLAEPSRADQLVTERQEIAGKLDELVRAKMEREPGLPYHAAFADVTTSGKGERLVKRNRAIDVELYGGPQ